MENKQAIESYRKLINCFFHQHEFGANEDQFWSWFLFSLTNKEVDVDHLTEDEETEILNKLNNLGDALFEPDSIIKWLVRTGNYPNL